MPEISWILPFWNQGATLTKFKVGFRQGELKDHRRRNWSGDGPRPINWSAWYPAADEAVEATMLVPAATPMFIMGAVAQEATTNDSRAEYPVVLLSHGTGGSASSLGWLARRMAAEGFIVVGVDHHGNTASEPYRAEGFLCWWERPRDLAQALNALAETGPFAGRLDLDRVSAAGFSLGGYAVLSLAGAITDMKLFFQWSAGQRLGNGPREFPRLSDHITPLLRTSSIFREILGKVSPSRTSTSESRR